MMYEGNMIPMDNSKKTQYRVIICIIAFILILVLFLLGLFSLFEIFRNKNNAIFLYPEWYEYVSPAFENVEITKCQIKGNTIRVEYTNTSKGTFNDKIYLKLSEEFYNNNPNYFPDHTGIEVIEEDSQPAKAYLSKLERLINVFK